MKAVWIERFGGSDALIYGDRPTPLMPGLKKLGSGDRAGGLTPRRPRVVIEDGVYHVHNRVAGGERLFADPEEAVRFVDLIRKVKVWGGWAVFAWCVMSSRYRIAVRSWARTPTP